MHRVSIAGVTKINKFKFDGGKVISYDTENTGTNVTSADFNGLYPSSSASIKSELIPYTGGVMYMPGRFKIRVLDKIEMARIVFEKKVFFFVSIKAHIPIEYYNEFINFPPIIRDYYTVESLDSIEASGKDNNKKYERKLTQLLSTMREFMSFYSYYLWFLIDCCHLIIDDYAEMDVFYIPDITFNEFITSFHEQRLANIESGNKALANVCKIVLNSSYGKDGMNTAKYKNTMLLNKNQTLFKQSNPLFVNTRQINDDLFAVQMSKPSYYINTPLQCACACLDNAKYWYMNFYYNFMVKCLDMDKIDFIEGDTDSGYYFVAGNPDDGFDQGFKNVIKDRKLHDVLYPKWFPDPSKGLRDQKKLLGVCKEKEGSVMYAVSPKCYFLYTDNNEGIAKLKGVMGKYNKNINGDDYFNVITKNVTITGINVTLREKQIGDDFEMTKQRQTKNAITPLHNKMRVLSNDSCAPFVDGLTKEDYIVI
jgi:hypothetical protein